MSGQIITSIQENMDPIKNPKIETGYSMVPAHNIGGEFVDLIRLNENRHIFVVGALSGKGIAASMNMVILKSIIRTFLAETKDFKILVQKVNLFIRESLPKGTYFAGTFGLIDFTTDTLYYINCGTPALFLYTRAYNNIIEIQGEGKVLGFVKDLTPLIKVKKVKLAPGDVVFTCTDGLIETKSLRGEEYGSSRIQSTLLENLTYPADKMVKFTYDSLVTFTSKAIENDVTMLILKYLGGK
jgi:serine phosphatase RsbU (regulator of sigma subunit)